MVEPLAPQGLRTRCDAAALQFETTAELSPLDHPLGQERALEALEFGVGIAREGFNLYVLGDAGVGKHSLVRSILKHRAGGEDTPADWCYLNNFADPGKPVALTLPPGQAGAFRQDMDALVHTLRTAIPAAFASEVYRARKGEIEDAFKQRQEDTFAEIQQEANREGMTILHTPAGFGIAPMRDGEVISPQQFESLDEDEKQRIQRVTERLKDMLAKALLQAPERLKQQQQEIEALNREVATAAIAPPIDELRQRYATLPGVLAHLDKVQADILENLVEFGDHSTSHANPLGLPPRPSPFFKRYQVNVIVDHAAIAGAPVIFLDNPSYRNIVGRVEYTPHMGTLVTDFTQIHPGALHRANNGYLVLEARKLLSEPYAWHALKRGLKASEITIESVGELLGLTSTTSLEPEPIPLQVKVLLLGEPLIYYLLCELDPDFGDLFKVAAEFEDRIERAAGNVTEYARLIATVTAGKALLPLDRDAVAEVIDHAARLASDADRLSVHMRKLADLLSEADHWSRAQGAQIIGRDHIRKTVEQQVRRVSRIRERIYEAIQRETLMIDTEGSKTGQVNGLSVLQTGEFAFGQPSRITATVRLGKGKVVDIQRESELGGSIHSKGVMILSAYLGARYAPGTPLPLSASLVFEQTYALVDGDSASLAELCALLSALVEAPIRQDLAVTGSVNQRGEVQAIGGVNEKIEGFFDVCAARGLSGRQGVLIPQPNVKHLMLREDIVAAASEGRFAVYPVAHIDEAISLLTGVPAGSARTDGTFPGESLNGRVVTRLGEYVERMQHYSASESG